MYIWWLVLYGFIFSMSERFSQQLDRPYVFFVLFITFYWGLLFYILYRKKQLNRYGICLPKSGWHRDTDIVFEILCLSFAALNLVFHGDALISGKIHGPLSWLMVIGELAAAALLVWGEEFFFRGVLPEILSEYMGEKNGQRGSVYLFAVLHLVNAWQLGTWKYVIVQAICAWVIGSMLQGLRSRSGSLFPGTVIHVLINWTGANTSVSGGRMDLTAGHITAYLFTAGVCLFFCRDIFLHSKELPFDFRNRTKEEKE